MPVRGQRNTQGSLVYAGHVADDTAPVAERILRAGGIVHARTATPEFSCRPYTHSRLHGITRNPWNLDYTPGGSSGGSAAALAAGTTALATGSDIGGSIRIPAAFCGVVGFKPPYGRVPESPPFNLDHYCHEGPLARTVADCALFENVIAGPHPADHVSLRPKLRIPAELRGIQGWRVALSRDLGGYPVDGDVAANTLAAADALREAGATVEEVEIGWDREELIQALKIHFGTIFAPYLAEVAAAHADQLTPYALRFAADAALVRKEDYLRALEIESRAHAALAAVFARHRLLLCPGFSVPALLAGEDYLDAGPEVDGVATRDVDDVLMTAPFNIASRCPVLTVPSGFARTGVPTAVQLVARPYDDVTAFRAGAVLERVRPLAGRPPLAALAGAS
jgi:Asp-tRNA(Asn)/Glu-tRNA(Gln) amidotransferase A subunit family amidase